MCLKVPFVNWVLLLWVKVCWGICWLFVVNRLFAFVVCKLVAMITALLDYCLVLLIVCWCLIYCDRCWYVNSVVMFSVSFVYCVFMVRFWLFVCFGRMICFICVYEVVWMYSGLWYVFGVWLLLLGVFSWVGCLIALYRSLTCMILFGYLGWVTFVYCFWLLCCC